MFQVRAIEERDIERIRQLEQEGFPDPWSISGLRGSFCQNCTVFLGVWHLDKLIGYVICYCAADEGEIARIAVDIPYRRQGAARLLLEELERVLQKRQAVKLLLDVRAGNKTAISFYRSFGFKVDGIRKDFYREPSEDAVLMSLEFGK